MPQFLQGVLATPRRKIIAAVIAVLVVAGGAGGAIAAMQGDDEPEVVVNIPTASPSPSPSPSPTPSPTPEPTPPPYDGAVVRLSMPRLGIDHYIEVVDVIGGQMQAPIDGVFAIGWYDDYDKPGWHGNAVFSAHETWNHSQGPFYTLYLAQPGDEIVVTMDNGIQYTYEVMSNVRYDVDTIPMGEVIWPEDRPEGEEWITLITCGGTIVYDGSGYGEYLQRDVVVARRTDNVGSAASADATPAATPAEAAAR